MKELSHVSVALIVECVAAAFDGVTTHDIRSRLRTADVALARQVVYWLAQKLTAMSLPEIGRLLGDRDHTTILHGLTVVDQRRGTDPAFSIMVDALRSAIELAAGRHAGQRIKDVDAVAVAERIMRNPLREATRVSTLDVAALAARLLALEELAGGTFMLLAEIDRLVARAADRAAVRGLIENVTGALDALGYRPEQENDHGETEEDQGAAAGTAAAAQ